MLSAAKHLLYKILRFTQNDEELLLTHFSDNSHNRPHLCGYYARTDQFVAVVPSRELPCGDSALRLVEQYVGGIVPDGERRSL